MAEKDTHPHFWLMERRYISLVIVLTFIILSAVAFLICYRHYSANIEQVLEEDRSNSTLLSLILDQHLKRIVAVMESYTNRPLLLQAVRDKNVEKAMVHLISLTKSDPDIASVIITDKLGTLWITYPERTEVYGKNFAYRDWYKDISKEWKPIISGVYQRVVAEKDLAIGIAIPIFNETGEVIGILQNTQRTVGLNDLFKYISLDPDASISLTDQKGNIIFSSRYDYEKDIKLYPFLSDMKKAITANNKTFTAVDAPDLGGRTRYISFAQVGNIGWTVFVGRDKRSILQSGSTYFIQVAGIAFLLFLSIVLFLAYSRKQVMSQQILGQLEAEKKIRAGEEKLRALSLRHEAILEAVPEIIMEVDVNKVYTWANTRGKEFFGDDVIGKEADFYFEGEQDTYKIVQPLFNGSGNVIYLESWQRRKDGEKRLLAWWCRVLKDENGQVTGALSSARDITEHRLADEEIVRLNAELEQRVIDRTAKLNALNKEMEAFSYSVSHDLRAPLRSIDGYSRILLEDYQENLDDKGKAFLEKVCKASQRMGLLIDDMLKLSRITKAEMEHKSIDLSRMIHEIIEERLKISPGRVADVTIREGIMVKGDPYLIKIVMENLVSNAFKFTGKKEYAKIEFGTTFMNGVTALFIRDNGAGFDMAYVDKLFGAFQRLHTTDEFPGTGIGLATIQRIIHRHGGKIWAEGEIGKGATFYFTLP